MIKGLFIGGAALAWLFGSAAAYADDPTGVLLNEQHFYQHGPEYPGPNTPAFVDVGPCQPGMQSVPFPNAQGYRCIPNQP